jgi:hypothetical protein
MIKFFRKIRQRLLSENKFSKYLLYAIGEVVLVVIGILIALNLNTNSENKKLVVQEIKILKEVKSELTVALEDVIDDLKDHERNLKSTEIIYNSILHKESYNDSLAKHYKYLTDEEEFMARQSAFESLKSIGIEIISNDSLRHEIATAYLYLNHSANKITDVTKSARELETLLKPHIMVDREKLLSDKKNTWVRSRGVPYKFINYKSFLNDDEFLYALMYSIRKRRTQIFTYKIYENGLENFIGSIEEEVKSLEKK